MPPARRCYDRLSRLKDSCKELKTGLACPFLMDWVERVQTTTVLRAEALREGFLGCDLVRIGRPAHHIELSATNVAQPGMRIVVILVYAGDRADRADEELAQPSRLCSDLLSTVTQLEGIV
eukprot:CAMPEP_0115876774 /NCGR_PEP_ID=MMETSP0287-20121206/25860_1 /TAXON_ID=412157 /ORGANISM="Chrysochromulina rotalis, Strain UIO044" /LENGTH=120 /DNA_ID=CAMNT_0003332227 /DNA_START=863 /DNA_END=1225 /DNA_ORIENTATION=+